MSAAPLIVRIAAAQPGFFRPCLRLPCATCHRSWPTKLTVCVVGCIAAASTLVQRRGARRVIRCRGLPPNAGVSRWILVSRGTPCQEDDPDGSLMKQVSEIWLDLEPKLMYLPQEERLEALSALCVAALAHKGQKRKSGEPYLIHPVAVAELLASLKVQVDVVIGGLLHDTVEDNPEVEFSVLESLFGRDVRQIVEGETKASKKTKMGGRGSEQFSSLNSMIFGQLRESGIEFSKARLQAENLRDMFLAMADDYRVILVKLADRLHNMRTLQYMPEKKRQNIAAETLAVFAPLAHRLGVWLFKTELEDLSFKHLYPTEFAELDKLLSKRRAQYSSTLSAAARDFKEILKQDQKIQDQNVKLRITGREKGMYSLWYKIGLKPKYKNNIDNVDDIIALRVVLHADQLPGEADTDYEARSNELCYHALSLAYSLPDWEGGESVKDYISYPKPNGYRSLHVTCMHKDNPVPLEIQIRSRQMHDVAEYGMAAHLTYKGAQHGEADKPSSASRRVAWLASLAEKDGELGADSMQFVQEVLREELGERCYVFLRDHKILNLSRGCTVLDAAFKIHTEVGIHMRYPEVNGQLVPLFYKLENGDRVNIVTCPSSRPKREWLQQCFLRSTRSKLSAYFRKKQETVVDLAAVWATAATAVAAVPLF
eukprot:TRINITY_DN32541_c0_g1_i1.p1 TRINITY_DN32541_c0_g1~~TRINITY_DN32541_c0_g1_i1.p1  ORF type:complete len:668 (+),score=110.59 TRINITY_DN32541_c0_g1_i1:40-2004(+)